MKEPANKQIPDHVLQGGDVLFSLVDERGEYLRLVFQSKHCARLETHDSAMRLSHNIPLNHQTARGLIDGLKLFLDGKEAAPETTVIHSDGSIEGPPPLTQGKDLGGRY